jgi:hypothetical protein
MQTDAKSRFIKRGDGIFKPLLKPNARVGLTNVKSVLKANASDRLKPCDKSAISFNKWFKISDLNYNRFSTIDITGFHNSFASNPADFDPTIEERSCRKFAKKQSKV